MGDQKYLPLIFPPLVTCLLTKTRGVQDFLEEDKEKNGLIFQYHQLFMTALESAKSVTSQQGLVKSPTSSLPSCFMLSLKNVQRVPFNRSLVVEPKIAKIAKKRQN